MRLHQIFCSAQKFLQGKYSDDSEGCSYGQLVIGVIGTMCPLTHHILCSFFCETSYHPGDSAPLQPQFGALGLLAFPNTKITFEREEISDSWWNSGEYNGAADDNWENCEVPRCLLWRRLRHHCPMYLVFSSLNVSNFYITCLDTFWTDLI